MQETLGYTYARIYWIDLATGQRQGCDLASSNFSLTLGQSLTPMSNLSEEQLAQVQQAAWQAAQQGDVAEAKRQTQLLIDQDQESGYQLRVMLHLEAEEVAQALALVQQGVDRRPDSWSMQLLLSDLLSMSGDGPGALAAVARARTLPGAEDHWVDISEATVYGRMMDLDRALNLLQGVEHPDAINAAIEMQFALLDSVGRHDLIIEIAEDELGALQAPEDANDATVLSRILTQVAQAYWYEEEDEDLVEHYLKLAIGYDRGNSDALYLRRELDGQFSEKSRTFDLRVTGTLQQADTEGPTYSVAFRTRYQVIADSEEEALALIQRYEPKEVRPDSLHIAASQSQPNEEEELKGVYVVGELEPDEGASTDA